MGVVAGDGAESQDQEVRAQRYRRELGLRKSDDIDEERVLYIIISRSVTYLTEQRFWCATGQSREQRLSRLAVSRDTRSLTLARG